jgi:hypothetical protein
MPRWFRSYAPPLTELLAAPSTTAPGGLPASKNCCFGVQLDTLKRAREAP